MCRFTMYLGPPLRLSALITEPAHSLINQSFKARERDEPLNGDGFGLAWYVPHLSDEPAVFRSVTPAWNNLNLHNLARVVESPCILAHVRAATQIRSVAEANCHPFRFRRHAFMHNGDLGGFARLRRHLLNTLSEPAFDAIRGSTDSEHLFALIIDALEIAQLTSPGKAPVEVLATALQDGMNRALELARRHGNGEPSSLNLALTDGRAAVVTRFTTEDGADGESLYLNSGRKYVCEGGLCRMVDPDDGASSILVSSEPLSKEPGWEAVPPNTMVLIAEDHTISKRPL